MPAPQSYKSHTRYDPVFHFAVLPLLLVNLGVTIYGLVHRHGNLLLHIWSIVMAIVFILIAGVARSSALRAQNRVIRLEERIRLATLLSVPDLARTQALTARQLVALRFASDAELPALALRTIQQGLTPAQIKEAIVDWRPDHLRV